MKISVSGGLVIAAAVMLGGTAAWAAGNAAPEGVGGFFIHDGDRVVFYGDSITDSQWYPTLVETFVLTRHPQWRNTFFERGQSGDNAGSLTRFRRDVVFLKPQAVTFMMGYNDGGYNRFDGATLARFLGNIRKSVEMARSADPNVRIMLVSPTPNETDVSRDRRWVSHDWYPYALLTYGHAEDELARGLGVPFVGMSDLYAQTMGLGHVVAGTGFTLSRDGVHPQREGHVFIAYHLLKAMGAEASLAAVRIDAASGEVKEALRCKVTELKNEGGALSFRRVCESLPYPTPPEGRVFSFLVHLDDTLNDDLLVVTGLTAPSYELSVDGRHVADLAAARLAEGVNLSRYPGTAMYEQALTLMDAVRKKDELEHAYWMEYIRPQQVEANATGPANPPAAGPQAAALAAIQEATKACYKLNTPSPHTIALKPLDKKIDPYDFEEERDINQAFLSAQPSILDVNWNSQTLEGNSVIINVANPCAVPRQGTISWECPTGWKVVPEEAEFTVAPGKKAAVAFAVSCAPGAVVPPPTARLRWLWSKDWARPMLADVPIELRPTLTINKSVKPVALDGNMSDWSDATTFTMDNLYFYDPAVTGKKALWNGPADLSGKIYLKWDDKALYLAAEVRDDDHVQNESDSMMWSQDMVHIAAQMQEPNAPAGRYEYGFGAYADRDSTVCFMMQPKGIAHGPEIRFKSKLAVQGGNCLYQVAIPWGRLAPFVPAEGKKFRFTLVVSDADRQLGKGFNYMAWSAGISYGKDPGDYGTIILGK